MGTNPLALIGSAAAAIALAVFGSKASAATKDAETQQGTLLALKQMNEGVPIDTAVKAAAGTVVRQQDMGKGGGMVALPGESPFAAFVRSLPGSSTPIMTAQAEAVPAGTPSAPAAQDWIVVVDGDPKAGPWYAVWEVTFHGILTMIYDEKSNSRRQRPKEVHYRYFATLNEASAYAKHMKDPNAIENVATTGMTTIDKINFGPMGV
jgi:hypothetical protein